MLQCQTSRWIGGGLRSPRRWRRRRWVERAGGALALFLLVFDLFGCGRIGMLLQHVIFQRLSRRRPASPASAIVLRHPGVCMTWRWVGHVPYCFGRCDTVHQRTCSLARGIAAAPRECSLVLYRVSWCQVSTPVRANRAVTRTKHAQPLILAGPWARTEPRVRWVGWCSRAARSAETAWVAWARRVR